MECAICLTECKAFKILECGHYFCTQCVNDLKRASLSKIVDKSDRPVSGQSSKGPTSSSLKSENAMNGFHHEKKTKSFSAALGVSSKQKFETESNGYVDNNIDPENEEKGDRCGGIPCPQCRRLTPPSYDMKNKYVCKLTCRDCDTEKSDDEFRWCYDCDQSTCSRCFVDKHVNNDSSTSNISMHRGCKWNIDYPQAVYCAKRLTQELQEADETIIKNQNYTKQYLEGLQEYMCLEIEQRIKASLEPKKNLISEICKAFVVDPSKLRRSSSNLVENETESKNSNKSYQTILDEIVKLADISLAQQADSVLHETLKLKCLPYKKMAEILIENHNNSNSGSQLFPKCNMSTPQSKPRQSLEINVNSKITAATNLDVVDQMVRSSTGAGPEMPKFDLKSTMVVENRMLTKPNDLCYLDALDLVLVTDYDAGLFFIDPKSFDCRQVEVKLSGLHWCRVTPFPSKLVNGVSNGSAAVVAVNALHENKEWKLILVDLEPKTSSVADSSEKMATRKIIIRGQCFKHPISFPDRSNGKTAFSKNGFYCVTSKSVYHMKKGPSLNWSDPIYTVAESEKDAAPCLGRPCSIVSNINDRQVQIYVFNCLWKCLDVLVYDEVDRKVLAIHRFDIFFDCIGDSFGGPSDGYFLTPLFSALQYPHAEQPNHNYQDDEFGCQKEGPFLIANQSSTKLRMWSGFTHVVATQSQSSKELPMSWDSNGNVSRHFLAKSYCSGKADWSHDLKIKYPQKIIRCPASLWYILQHAEKPNIRQIESTILYFDR